MVKMNQLFTLKPIKTLVHEDPESRKNPSMRTSGKPGLINWRKRWALSVSASNNPKGLESAILAARDSGRCSVIHIDVNPVKHMWAPNLKDFKDLHAEPAG